MPESVYRILYCSRNTMDLSLEEQLEEIRSILVTSRTNNAARNVTGALLFNAGCFAQVLEGPLKDVEYTFEKIQRDMRHDDVTVLEAGHVPQREFPEWSMAFAGTVQEMAAFSEFSLEHAFRNPSKVAEEIHTLLRTLVVQEDEFAYS